MRILTVLILLGLQCSAVRSQTASQRTAFDVASVKASQRPVGPDYNNQLALSQTGIKGRNVTLRRLIAEAYRLQMNQVIGPRWLDQNEFDIEAQAGGPVTKEQLRLMLQSLLSERFGLKQHDETRMMRAYELLTDKGGPKIQPSKAGEEPKAGGGFHFHGDMRQLADVISIQLIIPAATDPTQPARAGGSPATVLDRTGLSGVYDFDVNVKPELGTDGFTLWQRLLQDRLGLKLENHRGDVHVLVVDNVARVPTGN